MFSKLYNHLLKCVSLALVLFRTCSTGAPLGGGLSTDKTTAAEQQNHYHDSTSSTKSSLITGDHAVAVNGPSVMQAAKAAYEQKMKVAGAAVDNVHLRLKSAAQERLSESDERTEEPVTAESAGDDANGSFGDGPEVFLGGSCNPTTWRADVAIPTLNTLGISFYNPQVSDWTPDLIELEHRAKEKARVLFFVMDSETRATAGAIEAAHIAGSNSKQLVLVLHPYKPNQKILNETVSKQ